MPTGFASRPPRRFPLAGTLAPWFGAAALVLLVAGLCVGFFVAPTDHQQGDAYRIIYIHVPAAWMSMFIYLVMAFWAAAGLVFQNAPLRHDGRRARADRSALYVHRALDRVALGQADVGNVVGMGRAADLRIDSAFSVFRFHGAAGFDRDPRRADKAGAILALTGVNIPIIYFSVQWWSTLHQGASVSFSSAPTMAATMFTGMLLVAFAFWMYASPRAAARAPDHPRARAGRRWVGDYLEARR